jgi:hypothetical protein
VLQVYWRSGAPEKIGLAYDGETVRISEWNRTTKVLGRLLSGELSQRVSLRFVPSNVVAVPQSAERFMKKYGFAILATAKHSTPVTPDKGSKTFSYELKVNAPLREDFLKTTLAYTAVIAAKRPVATNLFSVLDAQAQTLHDCILMLVAAYCFFKREFESGSEILRHIDGSLTGLMPEKESPRINIRMLDMNCCLAGGSFRIDEIPSPDEIHARRLFAERASIYLDIFPDVATCLARIRFLDGDVKGAIDLTEFGIRKVKEGALPLGSPVYDKLRATIFLNHGFLCFMQTHWAASAESFTQMCAIPAHRQIIWDDVIKFADYVGAFHGKETSFLDLFYRLVARQPIDDSLRRDATEWVRADRSREDLSKLLTRVEGINPCPVIKQKQKKSGKHRKR